MPRPGWLVTGTWPAIRRFGTERVRRGLPVSARLSAFATPHRPEDRPGEQGDPAPGQQGDQRELDVDLCAGGARDDPDPDRGDHEAPHDGSDPERRARRVGARVAVSYTHLTLPTI